VLEVQADALDEFLFAVHPDLPKHAQRHLAEHIFHQIELRTVVANENLTQAFGTRHPAAGYRSPDQLEKWIECVTRLAEPKVSNDHSSDPRSGALSALGSLGGFRRRVVRGGGAVHRPDAEPRQARFQAVESLNRARLR
jgi:hypothetical protein